MRRGEKSYALYSQTEIEREEGGVLMKARSNSLERESSLEW